MSAPFTGSYLRYLVTPAPSPANRLYSHLSLAAALPARLA